MSKIGNNLRSFTLVEVMLAVVILGLGMSGVLRSYFSLIDGFRVARDYTDSAFLAKEKMSEFEQQALENSGVVLGKGSGFFSADFDNFKWEEDCSSLGVGGLDTLELSVFNINSKSGRQIKLVTYVKDKETK